MTKLSKIYHVARVVKAFYTVHMKKITFDFLNTRREYTDAGFLKVPGRVARTGVYEYLASELGVTDRAPNDIVKVYRPPEEVFKLESLDSYDNVDVTNDHPSELVNASTYKAVAVGTVVSAGTIDGDFVTVDMIIKDADTIKQIESGKLALSPGYTAVYDKAPEGADYDYVQRDIKINHVALVSAGRGGQQVKLFDNNGATTMPIKVTLDSGRTAEVMDEANASLIADAFDRLKTTAKDATAKTETLQATIDSQVEEIAKLKKTTSDGAIKSQVKALFDASRTAVKIAGKAFVCDSDSVATIQREALKVIRPTVDWATKSDEYVKASFDIASEKAEEMEDEEADAEEAKKKAANDAAPKPTNDGKPVKTGTQRQRDSIFGGAK